MAVVLHHSRAVGTDKVILLGVANHAGDGGAWPSVRTLAKYANVNARAAQEALRRLEASGELRTHLQRGGRADAPDHARTNCYDVLVVCPDGCDRTPAHRVRSSTPGAPERTGGGVPERTGGGVPEHTRTIHVNHHGEEPGLPSVGTSPAREIPIPAAAVQAARRRNRPLRADFKAARKEEA